MILVNIAGAFNGDNTNMLTRKGSKAYLSSSERYLTLHIIRRRP